MFLPSTTGNQEPELSYFLQISSRKKLALNHAPKTLHRFLILVYTIGLSASRFAQPSGWVTQFESLLQYLRVFLLSSHRAASSLTIIFLNSCCQSLPLLPFEGITNLATQYWHAATQLLSCQSCFQMTLKHFLGHPNVSQGGCIFICERFQ